MKDMHTIDCLMRISAIALFVAVLPGCITYPIEKVREQFGCEISFKGLWDTTRADVKPELKTAYSHDDNKLLRVFQVLDGAVLVKAEMGFWEKENLKSGILPEEKLNIYVETPDQYVDGEYLRHGLYEYTGTHVYTTTGNARATVRKYRKLPIEKE